MTISSATLLVVWGKHAERRVKETFDIQDNRSHAVILLPDGSLGQLAGASVAVRWGAKAWAASPCPIARSMLALSLGVAGGVYVVVKYLVVAEGARHRVASAFSRGLRDDTYVLAALHRISLSKKSLAELGER